MAEQLNEGSSSSEEWEMALELTKCARDVIAIASNSNHKFIASNLLKAAGSLEILSSERKRKRRCWVKKWMSLRNEKGSYSFLTRELQNHDPSSYKNYQRMDENLFRMLLSLVESDLQYSNTIMRNAVTPEERLCSALRYLATGESYTSLQYQTRLSVSFLCNNIPKVCDALWRHLKDRYMKFPTTTQEWEMIAEKFLLKWQFPLCLGALDGKHISFQSKKSDGAFYHNYKGTDSIILMALVDADCKFIFVDIGKNGRANDAGVFMESKLHDIVKRGDEHFPSNKIIGNGRCLPYVIVADDAFPLRNHIMKPYSFRTSDMKKQMFNSRLSRARQNVERAFGILANRFQILRKEINLNVENVENVEKVTKAACILHNFLLIHDNKYMNNDVAETRISDAETRGDYIFNVSSSTSAEKVRAEFAEYFSKEGKISVNTKTL